MSKYYKEVVGKRQAYRRVSTQLRNHLELIETDTDLNIKRIESNDEIDSIRNNINVNLNQRIIDITHTDNLQNSRHNESDSSSSIRELVSFVDIDGGCENIHFPENPISDNKDVPENNLRLSLRQWALKNKVSHTALRDLLHMLSPLHSQLPLDPRTLLGTPVTNVNKYTKLGNGEYCYFGLENMLQKSNMLSRLPNNVSDIKLSFNIDGIPLFNSSTLAFWPILCLIKNDLKFDPFVIAVYCGKSKPEPLESYLKDFVTELGDLLIRGCSINNKVYSIKVDTFICDAPARAFIKCIKGHSGYSSCEKCSQVGTYYKNRVIFTAITSKERNDESFALQQDEEHHSGISPLLALNIGLVSSFPIDYMHCICLGVMKKLLLSWVSGNLNVRLCANSTNNISNNLMQFRTCIPSEFNRKPRGLNEVAHWKATEFRAFLLYFGPIVLKNNVDRAIYEHFLLLHFGVSILCSSQHISTLGCDLAKKILTNFVKHSQYIYGLEYLIYNVHMLLHIADDAKKFGHLDSFSTFPFENTLGQLKRLIRSPNKPLQQIHRRIIELNSSVCSIKNNESVELLYTHFNGPLPSKYNEYQQYKKIRLKNGMTFSINQCSLENSYCLKRDNSVLQINNIITFNNDTLLVCKFFSFYESLYTYPFASADLNIFAISDLSSALKVVSIDDILTKCMVLPLNEKTMASFPLLHGE